MIHRIVIVAWLCLCLLVASAYADDEGRELQNKPIDKIDAILVLDASGSMLVTDPLRLRYEGAKLFTQFLKPGDRIGIISFAESANIVRELGDFSRDLESSIHREIDGIQSTGQFTNIHAGIQKARQILEASGRTDGNPVIVLLSDGKMEPEPASGSGPGLTADLVEKTLPDLRKQGIKIYTLAFSDQADKSLLQEIAALTDGINWFTPDANKIHEGFANLFLAVKKPQVVPLTKKGFKIDADVQEATFYINREDAEGEIGLTRPSGGKVVASTSEPGLKWFSGQKFEVVTITAPEPGDWQIEGVTTNDGFATVLTNLKLVTDWPSNLYAGEKTLIEARLYEQDKPVSLPEMSGVIKYAFQITPTDKVSEPIVREFLYDDGTHGDKVERDGIFSAEVTVEEAGEYKLRVLAKAPTFERNQQLPFRVKPPLISLSIEEPHEDSLGAAHGGEHADDHRHHDAPKADDHHDPDTHASKEGDHGYQEGTAHKTIVANLSEEAAGFKRIQVRLIATNKNRDRIEIPLTPSKQSRLKYEAKAALLPADGTYQLVGVFTAEGRRTEIRFNSKPLEFTRVTGVGGQEPEVKIIVKKELEVPASPVIPIILMSLLNIGGIVGVFYLLKGQKASSDSALPTIPSAEGIVKAIEALRARMEVTELDFNLPVFTDPNWDPPPLYAGAITTGKSPANAEKVKSSEEASDDDDEAQQSQGASPPAAEDGAAPSGEEQQG